MDVSNKNILDDMSPQNTVNQFAIAEVLGSYPVMSEASDLQINMIAKLGKTLRVHNN